MGNPIPQTPAPLMPMYPNGSTMAVQMYIWNINTGAPALWDGTLSTTGISIGAVKITDSAGNALNSDGNGNLQVVTQPQPGLSGSLNNSTSIAYENSRLVKATAGRLFGLTGFNSLTSAQFIQIHNAASLPGDGAVPVIPFLVNPNTPFSLDFGTLGRYFPAGIVICNSSTGPTKTIGSANCWFDAQFL